MTNISNLKILLTIAPDDSSQDERLALIRSIVVDHFKLAYKVEEVPIECDFIIDEVAVKRYRRTKAEGMKSRKIDSKTEVFEDPSKDFKPYDSLIKDLLEEPCDKLTDPEYGGWGWVF